MLQKLTTTYFDHPGPQNTEATFAAALERATQLGIKTAVVATDTGKTALQAMTDLAGLQVIAVTNPAGVALPVEKLHEYLPHFREHKQKLIDQNLDTIPASLSQQMVDRIEQEGGAVCRMDWQRFTQYTNSGLQAIDPIGVASRVAFTVAIQAFLAGRVGANQEVLALAGTGFGGGGADTALIVKTAQGWSDWRVLETIARPRESPPSEV